MPRACQHGCTASTWGACTWHNDLAEGRYPVHGHPVSLHDIEVPMFVVATERDHVSPWKHRHSSGKVKSRTVVSLVEAGSPVMAPGTYVHQR